MMEWTVVTALVVVIGLFITVGKPILNLVTRLEKLSYDTNAQQKDIDRNIDSIKDLVKVCQAHNERINNQESEVDKLAKQVVEVVALSAKHDKDIQELRERLEKARAKQMEVRDNAENRQ